MTMPNMGGDFDGFTMMGMQKTIKNNNKSMMHLTHDMNSNLDNCYLDENNRTIDKEINQFSQNSSNKDKDSTDRYKHYMATPDNKASISTKIDQANESPDFCNMNQAIQKDDVVINKSQIKNPSDIDKYVSRIRKIRNKKVKRDSLKTRKINFGSRTPHRNI